jgi:hypothetical protein
MKVDLKAKRGNSVEVPLAEAVAVIDSTVAVPREKRKEDASKPLYIERV